MPDINSHFIRGRSSDEEYSRGPKINNKKYSKFQTVSITISENISPNLFFGFEIPKEGCEFDEQLNLMYDHLHDYFNFKDLPKVGTVIVAKYIEDDRWYRGRVLCKYEKDKTVDVYFVDFGNIEKNIPLRRIRKLESTFSTQYTSFIGSEFLQGQAVFFGFIGMKPKKDTNNTKDKKIMDSIMLRKSFEFQIIEVSNMPNENRNEFNTRIPLYLIRHNPFNKSSKSCFKYWLKNHLLWEECSFDESIELLKNQIKEIDFDTLNVQIMMPPTLKDMQKERKRYVSKSTESESNNANYESCTESSFMKGHDKNESQSHEFVHNKISDKDNDVDSNQAAYHSDHESIKRIDVTKENDGEGDNDNEINNINVTIANWKLSNRTIKSRIPGLDWHFPVPENDHFPCLVSSMMEDNMKFAICICNSGFGETLSNLEKLLQSHYVLYNDSMLKNFIENNFEIGDICLCSYDATFYRCCIEDIYRDRNKALVNFIDVGESNEIFLSNLCPINEQFLKVPQFAIDCVLAGISMDNESKLQIIQEFNDIITKQNYQIVIKLCLMDTKSIYTTDNGKYLFEQPLCVEVFILNDEGEYESLNKELLKLNDYIYDLENSPGCLNSSERDLDVIREDIENSSSNNDKSDNDDVDDGDDDVKIVEINEDEDQNDEALKDFYLRENIYQQSALGNKKSQKPVCEYYRRKGRCFKGKKCESRHVLDSDDSDSEDFDLNQNQLVEQKKLFKSLFRIEAFTRFLPIGGVIGIRVTSIYERGVFYGYLTHGIGGFNPENEYEDEDNSEWMDEQSCSDISDNPSLAEDIGQDFSNIYELEEHLEEYLKYQTNPIGKSMDLVPGSIVAVKKNDKVHRATIKRHIAGFNYELFLLDYGTTIESDKRSLYFLPGKFYKKFRQQCFMFKLDKVTFGTEDGDYDECPDVSYKDGDIFVDWFYEQVNNKVLHAKVVSNQDECMYNVELYDFLNFGSEVISINEQVLKKKYLECLN